MTGGRAFALCLCALALSCRAEPRGAIVYAAASLSQVLPAIGERIPAKLRYPLAFNFAASGALVQQELAHSRADILITADPEWVAVLKQQRSVHQEADIAFCHVVLAVHPRSRLTMDDLPSLAVQKERIVVADPQVAPLGKYTRQILSSADELPAPSLWARLGPKLIVLPDARAVTTTLSQGSQLFGFVYSSDAKAAGLKVLLNFTASTAQYTAVRLPTNNPDADTFFDLLGAEATRDIWLKSGFSWGAALRKGLQ